MTIKKTSRNAGTANTHAKLTNVNVRAIRKAYKKGTSGTVLANRYGVTPASIYNITTGRTWASVQ